MITKIKIEEQSFNIEICNTFFKRLVGFMFRKKKITIGKCFPNCNSIHTFFMFQKIDVIFCDKNMKIIKIYKSFPKNRIILPVKNAYYTFELPENSTNKFKIGNQIVFLTHSPTLYTEN